MVEKLVLLENLTKMLEKLRNL